MLMYFFDICICKPIKASIKYDDKAIEGGQ